MSREVFVLLHNIRSMHNVGSMFRTADGAGVSKIYLTGYTPCPPRKEISKTALGADESVPWEYHKDPIDLILTLKKQGVKMVALEKNDQSTNLFSYKPTDPICLMVGNEIEGVAPGLLDVSDAILHIPMHGQKASLNVSVAFGVGVYYLESSTD